MSSDRDTYEEADWAASVRHAPLKDRPAGEAFLIYRHWIWANLQKIAFEQASKGKEGETFDPPEMVMVARPIIFMFVWYGLLWSVVEALDKRKIVMRGAFGHDIARMRRALKLCRHAVVHVPDDNSLLSVRIEKLVAMPDAVVRIRRIHYGLGRLLREEVQHQAALPAPLAEVRPGGVT